MCFLALQKRYVDKNKICQFISSETNPQSIKMKLIKAFAITASIGITIFFSPSSKAQTPGGWFYGGTNSMGKRRYIKPLGCSENNICRAA